MTYVVASPNASRSRILTRSPSSLPCATTDDAALIRAYVTNYTDHPNQFKYNGRSFLSTFAGDTCTFGSTSGNGWMSQVLGPLLASSPVYFVPAFFIDPATFSAWSNIAHGMFQVSSHNPHA